MGRDSATFRDKETENPSMFQNEGTSGQAHNLAMGREGTGREWILTACPPIPGQR